MSLPESAPRALISTIRPANGGVAAKTRWLCARLQEGGITPVLAWYEPWSLSPSLSVPLFALPSGRRPGQRPHRAFAEDGEGPGYEGHAIGAWLPELEFTHYRPTAPWRQLIASCDFHVAVSGNPLCAAPYAALGLPFLLWVGTPWQEDRRDRVRRFSLPRRLLDSTVNAPVLRRLERRILRAPGGRILTISHYTARALAAIAGRPMDGVLILPVETHRFHPLPARVVPWRVGFSGRYLDPRKRIDLLLDAIDLARRQGQPVELHLTGEPDPTALRPKLTARGLDNCVHCHPYLTPEALAGVLQSLDLFVIPSHQEGLCLAALEAMACGVPVVSTRCGGPEEFVQGGRTGELVEASPSAVAASILAICGNRARRAQLCAGARQWIDQHADERAARASLRQHWRAMYPRAPLPI